MLRIVSCGYYKQIFKWNITLKKKVSFGTTFFEDGPVVFLAYRGQTKKCSLWYI